MEQCCFEDFSEFQNALDFGEINPNGIKRMIVYVEEEDI